MKILLQKKKIIYYYTFSDIYGHPLSNGAKNYPKEQITWELITSLILKHWKYMPVKWIHFHGQNLNSLEKSLLKYRKKLTSWEWRKFYKVCTFFNFNLILLFKINHVKTLGGWVGPMGPTETEKFSFSHFFQFFVRDKKWKMDFLHFLPIFGLMLDIFDEFLKFSSILHIKNDKRWRKSLHRNFSQPTNENIC